jgi:hypothetical protein
VRSFCGEVIEFREDFEEPLRQATKFSTRLVFQLWLEQLEQMVSGGYSLAKSSEADVLWHPGIRHGELRNCVQGGGILPSTMKFSLQVELGHLHVAHSHEDVFVSEEVHQYGQTDAKSYHLCGIAMAQAMGSYVASTTSTTCGVGQDLAEAIVEACAAATARKQKSSRLGQA